MRCAYRYPSDGAQCLWEGTANICPEHRLMVSEALEKEKKRIANQKKVANEGLPKAIRRPQRNRPKFSQTSRVTSAKEIIDKLPEAPPEARLDSRVKELREKILRTGQADPSAPWCTCYGGCRCEKLKYNVWHRGVGERLRNQS